MEQLLQDMPINKADGSKGLLHHGTFGDAVRDRLPMYDVSKVTDSVWARDCSANAPSRKETRSYLLRSLHVRI